MSPAERRLVPRKKLRAQLQFHVLGSNAAEMLTGESQNISERGIYFTTDHMLEVGTPLELFVSIPSYGSKQALIESRCTARVVHVRTDSSQEGRMGIGASIERVEPPGLGARWRAWTESAPRAVRSNPERTGSQGA